ncbi:hypothetical protein HDU76_010661, partial [Blyttiomyces sp. JEL0837]
MEPSDASITTSQDTGKVLVKGSLWGKHGDSVTWEFPGSKAEELTDLRGLQCQMCNQEFVSSSDSNIRFSRVLELPSEYWHEKGHLGTVIPGRLKQVLNARNYVVLHQDDVRMDKLTMVTGNGDNGHVDEGGHAGHEDSNCNEDRQHTHSHQHNRHHLDHDSKANCDSHTRAVDDKEKQ